MSVSEVYNEDCNIGMARYPDKFFELAIVDPPYGININMNMGRKKHQRKKHVDKFWDDTIPDHEYFEELFRVSKNQIIWGGNYFYLPPTFHFIFWDKQTPLGLSFSDGEYAWTSFNKANRKFNFRNAIGNKIHPTEKPVQLYNWLLHNYATKGDKIIDTHMGSQSSRIACYKMGFDYYGWEIDKDYFEAGNERFNRIKSQGDIFIL